MPVIVASLPSVLVVHVLLVQSAVVVFAGSVGESVFVIPIPASSSTRCGRQSHHLLLLLLLLVLPPLLLLPVLSAVSSAAAVVGTRFMLAVVSVHRVFPPPRGACRVDFGGIVGDAIVGMIEPAFVGASGDAREEFVGPVEEVLRARTAADVRLGAPLHADEAAVVAVDVADGQVA